MGGLHTVQMEIPGQPRRSRKPVNPAINEECVGTQINMTALGNQAVDQTVQLGIEKRFSTADADDRGVALLGGGQTIFQRQPFVHDVTILADSAAPFTSQVAREQGF
jgi:hypothetical protein